MPDSMHGLSPSSPHYGTFLDDLVQYMTGRLDVDNMRPDDLGVSLGNDISADSSIWLGYKEAQQQQKYHDTVSQNQYCEQQQEKQQWQQEKQEAQQAHKEAQKALQERAVMEYAQAMVDALPRKQALEGSVKHALMEPQIQPDIPSQPQAEKAAIRASNQPEIQPQNADQIPVVVQADLRVEIQALRQGIPAPYFTTIQANTPPEKLVEVLVDFQTIIHPDSGSQNSHELAIELADDTQAEAQDDIQPQMLTEDLAEFNAWFPQSPVKTKSVVLADMQNSRQPLFFANKPRLSSSIDAFIAKFDELMGVHEDMKAYVRNFQSTMAHERQKLDEKMTRMAKIRQGIDEKMVTVVEERAKEMKLEEGMMAEKVKEMNLKWGMEEPVNKGNRRRETYETRKVIDERTAIWVEKLKEMKSKEDVQEPVDKGRLGRATHREGSKRVGKKMARTTAKVQEMKLAGDMQKPVAKGMRGWELYGWKKKRRGMPEWREKRVDEKIASVVMIQKIIDDKKAIPEEQRAKETKLEQDVQKPVG